MRTAVVLFNLGGPDSLDAVEPFLKNLFSDRAIIDLPAFLRFPIARIIARRRASYARGIYQRLGGSSPILAETQAQAQALDRVLSARGMDAKCFVAMRCWRPFSNAVAQDVKAWGAQRIVLLPLYPQFSTTTTASSFADWMRAADGADLNLPTGRICCFPKSPALAIVDLIHRARTGLKPDVDYRVLLSAHGLPKRTIAKGDPYQWQVERTAKAIVDHLGISGLDYQVCYQSRVGPLQWITPATDSEIHRAAQDGKGVMVVPIAFVSEHSETLVELDVDYSDLAKKAGVRDYIRVPTVSVHQDFVFALADLVMRAASGNTISEAAERICPGDFSSCPFKETVRADLAE